MTKNNYYQEQTIGSVVNVINTLRIKEINEEILKNWQATENVLKIQDLRFTDALEQVNKVRDFIGKPENILGSAKTKHGEIAENIEVHIGNAKALLEGKYKFATFDGVGRTAPEDYIKDGVDVQSKFYNGLKNTLGKAVFDDNGFFNKKNSSGILNHMHKYQNFGRDGSYYEIPKDQFEIMKQISEGIKPDGLTDKTIKSILNRIHEIEEQSGKSITEVVRPGLSTYNEVQQGVVHKTVDGHEKVIVSRHNELKDEAQSKSEERKAQIISNHKPSLEEAAKVGFIAALIAGGFSVALNVYNKHKEGKSLYNFTSSDWNSVGVDFTKGSIQGGITGVTIYAITNYTNVGVPAASAFVSTIFGVKKLADAYKKGEISQSEFIDEGYLLCLDSGAVALGATAGQILIPIPIVGALVGTFAAKTFMSICNDYLGERSSEIEKILKDEYTQAMLRFDIKYQSLISEIIDEYESIGEISQIAFSVDINMMLESLNASIQLAYINDVDENRILMSVDACDDYFLY